MLNFEDKSFINKCTGCSACSSICPDQAIQMELNEEGFLYPKVDKNLCINCGLCDRICLLTQFNEKSIFKQQYYAVRYNNKELINSTSGAMFRALSEYVIKIGGYVVGVIFDEHFRVTYKVTNNLNDLKQIVGVKYVQADLGNTFEVVKELLDKQKMVLFSGTPCAVAGLLNVLNKEERKNILTVDLICHGVPSPLIWLEFINEVRKIKGKINKLYFRYKKLGWHGHNMYVEYANGKTGKGFLENAFCCIYFSDYITRKSCYTCKYSSFERSGDFTIGDFWGIEKLTGIYNDEKGVSLVILNTEKSEKIFNLIKDDLSYIECGKNDCIQYSLQKSTEKPKNRFIFWNDYNKYGFSYCLKKYSNYGFKYRFSHFYLQTFKNVLVIIFGRKFLQVIKCLLKR